MTDLIHDAPNLHFCLQVLDDFLNADPKPGDAAWEKQKQIAANAVAHIRRLEGKEPGWENLVKCPTRQEYLH